MTIFPAVVKFERAKAKELWHDYKKHLHYARPIDKEIGRAYQLLAQGKLIIRAYESIKAAGIKPDGRPVLAIARADWKQCVCQMAHDGSTIFSKSNWPSSREIQYKLPPDTFPRIPHAGRDIRGKTYPPVIPLNVRPKRGLQNYAILWEAEWQPVPPSDPLLLRQIGKSDLWLVVAQWDLTEVEKAVLATRIRP